MLLAWHPTRTLITIIHVGEPKVRHNILIILGYYDELSNWQNSYPNEHIMFLGIGIRSVGKAGSLKLNKWDFKIKTLNYSGWYPWYLPTAVENIAYITRFSGEITASLSRRGTALTSNLNLEFSFLIRFLNPIWSSFMKSSEFYPMGLA